MVFGTGLSMGQLALPCTEKLIANDSYLYLYAVFTQSINFFFRSSEVQLKDQCVFNVSVQIQTRVNLNSLNSAALCITHLGTVLCFSSTEVIRAPLKVV